MITRDKAWFYFTVQDIVDECGGSIHTIRSRVARLSTKGDFFIHRKLRPSNQNVYASRQDPLVVLREKLPELQFEIKPGFYNNPFNMQGAIDMRFTDAIVRTHTPEDVQKIESKWTVKEKNT
jgi:hypothetical protein